LNAAEPYFRYEREVKLAGVIYFHRISDERWRRSDTRSFGWLHRICGDQTLRNVVFVTNMWGNVNLEVGAVRERQLAEEFVKPAIDRGAQLLRHHDTTESAHNIIRSILKNRREVLQVQQELVDERREFNQTTVGEEINRQVEENRRKLEQQVEALQRSLANVQHGGAERRSQLEAEVAELLKEIKRYTEGSRNMNASYKEIEAKAKKLSAPLLLSAGGIGIGGILLWALVFCYHLYWEHQRITAERVELQLRVTELEKRLKYRDVRDQLRDHICPIM
jgi:hypothetical protein